MSKKAAGVYDGAVQSAGASKLCLCVHLRGGGGFVTPYGILANQ